MSLVPPPQHLVTRRSFLFVFHLAFHERDDGGTLGGLLLGTAARGVLHLETKHFDGISSNVGRNLHYDRLVSDYEPQSFLPPWVSVSLIGRRASLPSLGASLSSVERRPTASSVTVRLLLRSHSELVSPVVSGLVRAFGLRMALDLPPPYFLVTLCGFQEPLPQVPVRHRLLKVIVPAVL